MPKDSSEEITNTTSPPSSLVCPPVLFSVRLPHCHVVCPSANMWILPLIGYLGAFVGFCFLTLAIGT